MDGSLVIYGASPGSIDELCVTAYLILIGDAASNATRNLDRHGTVRTEKDGRQQYAMINLDMRNMGM